MCSELSGFVCTASIKCHKFLPLQKRAKKSPEFRGKIPGFPRFFAHKEKPGKPGVSWLSRKARRLLAFHVFQEILESVESQETPHFPGFPRFHCLLGSQECYSQKPGKAWKARKKCSTLSWLSPMCKKARKAGNDSQLSKPLVNKQFPFSFVVHFRVFF